MTRNNRSAGTAARRARSSLLRTFTAIALLPLLCLLPACGGDDPAPPPAPGPGGYTLLPEATWKTGVLRRDAQGNPLEWMLPSSQRITPLSVPGSRLLEIQDLTLPLGLTVHPRGDHLFLTTAGNGNQALLVIHVPTGEIVQRIDGEYFLGLAFRPPLGEEVYVSTAGRNLIETYAFDYETGTLTPLPGRSMPLPGFAGGLCVSRDGTLLLAVSQEGNRLAAFDLATAGLLGQVETGTNPYTVALHPGGQEAYVTCEEPDEVHVYDVSDPANMTRTSILRTQKNPEALLVNQAGTRLYVTNADADSLSVFSTGQGAPTFLRTIDLRDAQNRAYGSSPNALAFSPSRNHLYIAQAGLNKLAVLDLESGSLLGEIPTAWYPTAVALHTGTAQGGNAPETLFVANGKGVGTPWEGDMGHVPGRLSILPVPPEGELSGLTQQVQENNAFPGRLFRLQPGPWTNPIPRERGGPTPIKYIFIVVRENKTYDYLLGPYRPARGTAEGDPEFVMEEYERLLPNLYKLVERFTLCDNYYSNAEASNQGHQILTSSTVNTYVEKTVFAEHRSLPIQLEMVLSPVAWPKKDYIFQNAMEHGISFRDYGEGVGVGKDLLILDDDYVNQSLIDPPWFWMFSKDENKILERIEQWESDRFAGPRFPRLIFMLLPNDHTWGSRLFFPSYKSMIADNDLATGLFVEWLSRSPYWMESAVFITEDDPQQGNDHIDPHRTMMLVVSPWARRGHVSHVRYNEANLFATVEYLLGLPPLTIFDEAAQPMYDLFDFSTDAEPFEHEAKDYPWEYNLPGTLGSRETAQMDFSEPDEAEGLMEMMLAMEAEEREAKRPVRRVQEKAARAWDRIRREFMPGGQTTDDARAYREPDEVLEVMKGCAEQNDREGFEALLDRDTAGWAERYVRRRASLQTDILPGDPVGELMVQFREQAPRTVSRKVGKDGAQLNVIYRNGISAELLFRREPDGWKLDLSRHLAPTVRIMDDAGLIQETYEVTRALKQSSDTNTPPPRSDP